METIKKILRANYVDTAFNTHVSMVKPKGKYYFNRQTLEEFWDNYCSYVTDEKENVVIGIAEKPQTCMPVLVDIDLRVRADDYSQVYEDGLYTQEQLLAVVQFYQSTLRAIVEDCKDEDLLCVVLEKKMYQQNKNDISYFKHGFHLHFPCIFLEKADQEVQVIPRVQDLLKTNKTFDNLGIEDSSTVLDKACCQVPWLLYGSRKTEESQPYRVTKVLNSALKEVPIEKAFRHYQIFDYKEKPIQLKNQVQHYLPRILSIIPYGRESVQKKIKKGVVSPLKDKMKKERKISSNHRKLPPEEVLRVIKKLLPLIADWRAEDRTEWMNIGWSIYNETDGCSEGLELWQEFSSRCLEKYDETQCTYQWNLMVKKDITMGTLKYYAKIDNPVEYRKFQEEMATPHLKSSLEGGSHYDVARVLYELYGDEYVCGSITNRVWFRFNGRIWEQMEEAVYLRDKISTKVVEKFAEEQKRLTDEYSKCQDKGENAMITVKLKQTLKMMEKLKSTTFKNSVMREACDIFYDPEFRDKLDTNAYLIAFKNGVYDLQNNFFRPGRPEDYLSKSLPINYINYSEDDEKVFEVYSFLEKVFPDKSLRTYFLDNISDLFVGGNTEKTVNFWTGSGDNAKSVTQKFLELMFGKLAIKLNTNVITGKQTSAGSAFADLARAGGGVRLAVLEEPNPDEVINPGIFKKLSGNDSFYARDLFEKGKDGREIVPMFKLIFITNKLPRFRAADRAVWSRVRVIPYESTFVRPDDEDPAPETQEEQMQKKRFPMDKRFSEKIPGLVEAFAWVLLQHRQKIVKRIEPPKVLEATKAYSIRNDANRQFVEECIEEKAGAKISLIELYTLFKLWYRDSIPGQQIPIKQEVEEYFLLAWGNYKEAGKVWKGYAARKEQKRAKEENEEDEKTNEDEDYCMPDEATGAAPI